MEILSWIRTWLWDVEPLRYYVSAFVVSLAVVLLPERAVKAIGTTTIGSGVLKKLFSHLPQKWQEAFGPVLLFCANMVSVWRLFIFWVGYCLFHHHDPLIRYIGFVLMSLGLALDRLDGRIAELCGQKTAFGEWFDPLIDKFTLTVIVVDVALSWISPQLWPVIITCLREIITALPHLWDIATIFFRFIAVMNATLWAVLLIALPCIIVIIIAEIMGILVRPPFNLWSGRRKTVKATGIGKMKFLLMAVYLMVALPSHMNWFKTPSWGIYTYLIMSALLAILSVASRFVYRQAWLNKLVEASTKPFLHIKRNNVKIYFGRVWRLFFRRRRNSNSGPKPAITR